VSWDSLCYCCGRLLLFLKLPSIFEKQKPLTNNVCHPFIKACALFCVVELFKKWNLCNLLRNLFQKLAEIRREKMDELIPPCFRRRRSERIARVLHDGESERDRGGESQMCEGERRPPLPGQGMLLTGVRCSNKWFVRRAPEIQPTLLLHQYNFLFHW